MALSLPVGLGIAHSEANVSLSRRRSTSEAGLTAPSRGQCVPWLARTSPAGSPLALTRE